ncbi:PREDICTED: esterase FE4-like [Rhagoletis zephyria]|uniref:esterase FE4-like n=1 Tax=Rhagoletis zephyria TaxID=28612 RepID=UPI000811378C|nr:PREDICTED: esterase FE4-like [Rhagoletis zephyria]XP_017461704.1 PREDICTED: esterase FE4-like [Rhagoletis zephyria]
MLSTLLVCKVFLFFVQLAHQQAVLAQEAPLIETSLGRIRGSVLTSRKGRDIYAYRGIYYAEAPIGSRRFAAPEPVQAWNDTLNALADGPMCPQELTGALMDEDCLSLNVYTTNETASNPVVVYIHGGANKAGSANSEIDAGPQYLLDEDIVLVGIFFRVGAFGFLSTGTEEAPGNYGHLDQVLALKWVKEHIYNFGGDPNRVTLLGQSAGSFAVTLHLVSPLSAGLFHGAIALSGSTTHQYLLDNKYWSRRLAYDLGCPMYEAKYLVNCLRQISWEEITNASVRWDTYGILGSNWNFEIDGNFVLEDPSEAIGGNRINRVPIITGVTQDELDFDSQFIQNNTDLIADIDMNFGLYAREFFEFNSTGNDDERAKSIRQFYYNESSINQYNLLGIGQILSDALIGHGVYRLVQLAKDHTNVYYYRFDYVGEKSWFPDSAGMSQGACHGDDLNYILKRRYLEINDNSTDMLMVERMTNLVASFAANGSPPAIDNITWSPYTANNTVVMYLNSNSSTGDPFYVDRYALWDKLFPLAESSAGTQLPAVVLWAFAAAWNILF